MSAAAMAARYGATAQVFHWLGVVLLATAFGLGLWMVSLPLLERLSVVPWHKSVGVTIFVVTALRLGWRLWRPPPPLPDSVPPWERRAAAIVHVGLYVLMLAVPLSGWLMSSALGFATVPFGLAKLPDLLARNRELGDTLKVLHFALNKTLLALIALHVAAALKHRFIDRDGVLGRMLPWRMPSP